MSHNIHKPCQGTDQGGRLPSDTPPSNGGRVNLEPAIALGASHPRAHHILACTVSSPHLTGVRLLARRLQSAARSGRATSPSIAGSRLKTAISLALAILAGAPTSWAEDCTEGVDWTKRVVCAKGIGGVNPKQPKSAARPGAIRTAQVLALRQALELVKGIPITSTTTVANGMAADDNVRTKVEGFVKGFRFGEPHYMDDLTIEMFVELPLDGIGEIVLPSAVAAKPSVTAWSFGADGKGSAPTGLKSTVYTGLVVDARGLGVLPALAPRILEGGGKELYGTANVEQSWAAKHGLAGYAKTVEGAMALKDRVGDNPCVLKAVSASGAAKTDLVVGAEDALLLKGAAQNLKFLAEARVVFVVD